MKFLLILIIFLSGCASTQTVYLTRDKIIPASVEYQPIKEKKELTPETKIDAVPESSPSTSRIASVHASSGLLSHPSSPPRPTSIIIRPAPAPAPAPPSNIVEQPVVKSKPKTIIIKDTVASQLYEASAAFVVPNKANISQDIKAELVIDSSKTLTELRTSIEGQIQSIETIKVSKIVIAKIDAPDFVVSELTTADQALSNEGKTTWIWNLRPKSSGLHEINLTVMAEVTIGNKQTKYHIRTFDKQVMIEVTPIQIFKEWWVEYWQWVMSTLILPLIIYIYSRYKSKK